MAYSLIKNQFGNYVLNTEDTLKTSGATIPNPKEFEAYTGTQKTELVGGTTLGAQTQEILKREAPGQFNLEYDPVTGQYKQKGEVAAVQTQQFKPITSLETGTSQAVQPQQTALEKAQSIISATPYKSGMPDIDVSQLAGMFSPQQMSTKQQLLNTVLSAGQDIATSYILDKMGIGGGGIPGGAISMTPLKGGTFPGTTYITPTQAGLGGGTAAAVGTLLAGGSVKEAAKTGVGAGVGTAIGTAVGGPIGGAIGGFIGGAIGGRVICTELYRQNLMSKEDYIMDLEFTRTHMIPKHGTKFLNGYWTFAVPAVKSMRKSKLSTMFWKHIACNRAQDIKWRLGKGKFNILGRAYSLFFENLCSVLGRFKKKQINYSEELYA
jgi:hypothetical protein